MYCYKIRVNILCAFLIFIIVLLSGCREQISTQSRWLDRVIVIDAKDTDWIDYPYYYDKKTSSSIGLYNDDKNLFIYLQTSDKDIQRRILGQGLFVWFNKTGKKDKELALNFPSGRRFGRFEGTPPDAGSGKPNPPPDMSSGRGVTAFHVPDESDASFRDKVLQGSKKDEELRILSSEKDEGYKCTLERAKELGIEVRYAVDDMGMFIYELKMPVVETEITAFIAEASETNNLGMGFLSGMAREMPNLDYMDMGDIDRGPRDDGGIQGDRTQGGGMGGGMPGRGGMRGGPMNGGEMEKGGKNFEIWINVTLASKPAD